MEQVKSKGKLQGFTRAILGAANERADAVHAEADEQERSTIERYRAEAHQRAEQRRSIAQSEIKAREDKRVMSETLAARRSLLSLREECAMLVLDDVRARLETYPGDEKYAGTLENLLLRGLAAIPGAKTVRVLLRREDAGHEAHLRAAAPEVELSFAEGKFELGGMIIEFPMQHRRSDLTFDTALEDLSSRFTEITGFGMEDSDGK